MVAVRGRRRRPRGGRAGLPPRRGVRRPGRGRARGRPGGAVDRVQRGHHDALSPRAAAGQRRPARRGGDRDRQDPAARRQARAAAARRGRAPHRGPASAGGGGPARHRRAGRGPGRRAQPAGAHRGGRRRGAARRRRPGSRPTFVGADLAALGRAHPAVAVRRVDGAQEAVEALGGRPGWRLLDGTLERVGAADPEDAGQRPARAGRARLGAARRGRRTARRREPPRRGTGSGPDAAVRWAGSEPGAHAQQVEHARLDLQPAGGPRLAERRARRR